MASVGVVTLGIGSQLGLRPSVTIVQAEAQLNAIQAQVLKQISAARRNEFISTKLGAVVQPMQEAVVGDSKTALWLLMAAVLGLMLTACLNLASAQLGRALLRQREVAMRAALGAAKGGLNAVSIWNALAENLILAAIGGVAGVLLAEAALHLFCSYSPADLPRLAEVGLSPAVLLFSIALTVGASVLCGLLPA
jgi:ABC-type antimicrobial peptide transport system permease subunit